MIRSSIFSRRRAGSAYQAQCAPERDRNWLQEKRPLILPVQVTARFAVLWILTGALRQKRNLLSTSSIFHLLSHVVAPKRFHNSKGEPPLPIEVLPWEYIDFRGGLSAGEECHAGRLHRILHFKAAVLSNSSQELLHVASCKQLETYSALVVFRFWQPDCSGSLRGFPTRLSSLGHVLLAV